MRVFFIFLLLINFLDANSRDFYYSFIGSQGKQIPESTKEQILSTLDGIDEARELYYEGKPKEAFEKIEEIKNSNKISILKTDILLLYSELVLKFQSKKILNDATNELEKAVNDGTVNQENLLQAYLLLVELKLSINKIDEAKYYSKTLVDIFDTQKAKIRGKISQSKIYRYQKNYQNAEKVLYEALNLTSDRNEASNIANELFDVYLLAGKTEEARSAMEQILNLTPSFYSNDFILANKRADMLFKLGMDDLGIKILKDIILNSKNSDILNKTKYKLANIYLNLYKRGDTTSLNIAKALLKSLVDGNKEDPLYKDSKIYYDEIKMRKREIEPTEISHEYTQDETMQQKAILQEFLNYSDDKKYEDIVRGKDIYKKIPKSIQKRFDINNLENMIDIAYLELIKDYIAKKECEKLRILLKDTKRDIFVQILNDELLKNGLIACIQEKPDEQTYEQLKDILKETKDENIYFVLESIAFGIGKIDDAVYYSSKISNSKNIELLKDEFFTKYQVLKEKNDFVLFDRFLKENLKNNSVVEANLENPMIIDFYYDLYMYLKKIKDEESANKTLEDLNNFQNSFKVFVYSPVVELELAKIAKDSKNYEFAVKNLKDALLHTRNIKKEDEVRIYYELANLYQELKDNENRFEFLQKCKDIELDDNLYKTMCESMN